MSINKAELIGLVAAAGVGLLTYAYLNSVIPSASFETPRFQQSFEGVKPIVGAGLATLVSYLLTYFSLGGR